MADTKPTTSAAAAAAAAPAPAAGKTAAAPKPKAEPKPPRFNPKATVHFLKTKDGTKTYGPATTDTTVNPKRAGTKSFDWFANYSEGITIEALAEKFKASGGSMNSNLDWDTKHGFIEIKEPAAAKA